MRNVVGEKYDGKLIIRSSQQGGRYHTRGDVATFIKKQRGRAEKEVIALALFYDLAAKVVKIKFN